MYCSLRQAIRRSDDTVRDDVIVAQGQIGHTSVKVPDFSATFFKIVFAAESLNVTSRPRPSRLLDSTLMILLNTAK